MVGIFEESAAAGERSAPAAAAGCREVIRALIICASLVLVAASGFAQTPDAAAPEAVPKAWGSLSPQQQQLLQSHQGEWDSLPAERQQALAKGSQRWLSMTPQERAGAQQRFTQWRAMPPEQRQLLRQRWQQFKSLPPERQQQLRESFNRFRQMPPEQRSELRRQWRQMTPEQRHYAVQHGALRAAPRPQPHPPANAQPPARHNSH